jgi:hypothetical protein
MRTLEQLKNKEESIRMQLQSPLTADERHDLKLDLEYVEGQIAELEFDAAAELESNHERVAEND